MKSTTTRLLILLIIMIVNHVTYSKPNILVTITPIASLVSMLTKDKANIVILDSSGGCPHHHKAKLSDKALVDNSEMVIYIDNQFDSLISSMILNYSNKKVKISNSLIDFTGIDGKINWHFWLDLENVRILQKVMAEQIIQTFPEIKDDVEKNLKESLEIIDGINKWKRFNLLDLDNVILLSDSLEHFFKSINNFQIKVSQTSNASLKNIKKLDNILNSHSLKCIVLDNSQSTRLYSKYNKLVVKLESENWEIKEKTNLDGNLFIDQYSKMIKQLTSCRK